MSVVIETTLGDVTVDLYIEQRPTTCLNFLKLCKMKYYNYNLFHTIRSGFIAQTGDPTGEGSGGKSIWGILEGDDKRFFSGERRPKIRHADAGLLSMVCTGEAMVGSQFFFTLGPDLDSLDDVHIVIGEVTEGHEVLRKLNDAICDETHRPYQDVRITHTVVLDDPFSDPKGLRAPSRSPSPSAERLKGGRIAPDEELNETEGKSAHELQEMIEEKEAKARATILEIVGDLPDADIAPPENVLFVCKLNPVTSDEDLEIIFSRFGKIVTCEVIRDKKTGDSLQYAFIEFADKKSCEDAYFKMDNVLIDDRRIHVDFSQSVSKIKWLGKGRGVKHFSDEDIRNNKSRRDFSGTSQSSEHNRNHFRENRERHSESERNSRTDKNRDWEERNRVQGNKERVREKKERRDRDDQDNARKSVREESYKDRENENKKDGKRERIEIKRDKEDKDKERKRNREERNRPREDENKEKERKKDREHRNRDREDENKDKDRKRIREERNDKKDRNDSRQNKELTRASQRISRSRSPNRTKSPVKENKSRDKNQSPNKEIKERENRRSFKDNNERGSHSTGVKDKRASAEKVIKERNSRSPPHETRERERSGRNRQQNEEIRKNKITDSPDREKRHKESFERRQEQFNVDTKERNRSMSPMREKCISGRKVDRYTDKNPSKYPQDTRDHKYDYKNVERIKENYKNGRDRDHTDRPKDRKRSDSGNNMNGKLGDRDSAVKRKRQHEVSDNIQKQNNDRKTKAEKEKGKESAALCEKRKKTMTDRKDKRSKILKKTKIVKKRKHSTSSSSDSSSTSSDSSSSESDHKRKKSSKNSKKRKYSTSDSSSSTSSSSSSSSSSSDSSSDSSTSSSDSEPKQTRKLKSNATKNTAKKNKKIK